MAIENETADQVVRMMLQGSEVILRLTGEAALRIAPMIYAALKDGHTTKGKATLWEFLKSGKDQKMFRIPDEYLKAFTTASKKFGFPFVVLKDKSRTDGLTDIMVYATDASKVSRVIEKFNLMVKQAETIKPEIKTGFRRTGQASWHAARGPAESYRRNTQSSGTGQEAPDRNPEVCFQDENTRSSGR